MIVETSENTMNVMCAKLLALILFPLLVSARNPPAEVWKRCREGSPLCDPLPVGQFSSYMHYNVASNHLWLFTNRPISVNVLDASDGSQVSHFTVPDAGPDTATVKHVAVHESASGAVDFMVLMTLEGGCGSRGKMIRVDANGDVAWNLPMESSGMDDETRVPEYGGPVIDRTYI